MRERSLCPISVFPYKPVGVGIGTDLSMWATLELILDRYEGREARRWATFLGKGEDEDEDEDEDAIEGEAITT